MKIKDPQLLFESQIPSALNASFVGWNTSSIKLQQLYKNEKFKEAFLSVYNNEYSEKFTFRDVQNKITQTCNFAHKLADSVSNYTGKKIRFADPSQKKINASNVSVSDDVDKELENVQKQLISAREYLQNKMKDVRNNWTDDMGDLFCEKMTSIDEAMKDLHECCCKIQQQMRTKVDNR